MEIRSLTSSKNKCWFVAYVRSCQERRIAAGLAEQGIDCYVPVREVKRRWSDRIKVVEQLILPGLVFVHCDERRRQETFKMVYGICSYLVDRTSDVRKVMVVPENQMSDFIRVVNAANGHEENEVSVVSDPVAPGDKVRVIRGPLTGFVCECVQFKNRQNLIIRLGELGSVLMTVSASDVVKN